MAMSPALKLLHLILNRSFTSNCETVECNNYQSSCLSAYFLQAYCDLLTLSLAKVMSYVHPRKKCINIIADFAVCCSSRDRVIPLGDVQLQHLKQP